MKCEFCGALPKPDWDGCDVNWFHCGTMYPYGNPWRSDQTARCRKGEREKLSAQLKELESTELRLANLEVRIHDLICDVDAIIEMDHVNDRRKAWRIAKEKP